MNSSNVQSLLYAANQYQIEPVKRMCVEFLKGQIDATNCLGKADFFFFYDCRAEPFRLYSALSTCNFLTGISSLADCMDCPELQAAAEDFFQLHFTEVYKLDEFLQLDVKRLTYLLHQDKLTVRSEAQVNLHISNSHCLS